MKMHRSKKGFTLVEIMIVVVIIGLLAALAIPAFNKVRATSQDKHVANTLRQIAGAADQYMMEKGVNAVDVSNLFGNSNYVAGQESNAYGALAKVPFDLVDDGGTALTAISATLTQIVGSDIAGSGRSVAHDK
jgi:prepilin-type N-terminal cleavage/methylation domain-containing protein